MKREELKAVMGWMVRDRTTVVSAVPILEAVAVLGLCLLSTKLHARRLALR